MPILPIDINPSGKLLVISPRPPPALIVTGTAVKTAATITKNSKMSVLTTVLKPPLVKNNVISIPITSVIRTSKPVNVLSITDETVNCVDSAATDAQMCITLVMYFTLNPYRLPK